MTVPRRSPKSDAKPANAKAANTRSAKAAKAKDAKADPGPEPRRRRRSRRRSTSPETGGTGAGAGDPAAELALMAELAGKAAGNLAGLADLAELEVEAGVPAGPGGVRRIAVVVADGREAAMATVLDKLRHKVDELVVVHDGTDRAIRAEVEVWLAGQDHRCRLLTFDAADDGTAAPTKDRGAPAALRLALTDLRRRLVAGELDARDLVLTAGPGGRHDLDVLDDLHRQTVEQGLDALLVRRDRSARPRDVRLAHRLLAVWASLWTGGVRLHDPSSPYRILRLGPLVHALDHHDGRRRSEAVELAVILSRLRYTVRNDVLVDVPAGNTGGTGDRGTGRGSRLRLADLVAAIVAVPRVALRVTARRVKPRPAPSLVPPLAVCLALVAAPALVGRALVRAVARKRRQGPHR